MNLTFTGGRELARTLRQLPEAVARNVLVGSVTAGAGIIREAAAAKARGAVVVAGRWEQRRRPTTARLADTIKVTVTEQARTFVTVCVGTKVRYAHLIEYGHQIVARGPSRARVSITTVRISKRTGKEIVSTRFGLDPDGRNQLQARRTGSLGFVPARPFLRPAFDENREPVLQKIGSVLGAGIEAESRRLASSSQESPTVLAPGLAA
jgi:HK97 gp10 family phage protein